MAATGVLMFVRGIPWLRTGQLTERVAPYLNGLEGRPTGLLTTPGSNRKAALGQWIQRQLGGAKGAARLQESLSAAGLEMTPQAFRVDQLTWGVAGMVAVWVLAAAGYAGTIRVSAVAILPLSVLALATGFLGREWLLGRLAASRRKILIEELPTAIDLVTLAIMAGESVPAAFERAGRILGDQLGAELRRVVGDIRAGASTVEALEGLSTRLPVTGIARFVDSLCTGIEKGAPLADVLRAQAEDGREARRRSLLEMGGRREVLMLIPVVFLIMPVVVVFSLFPGLVSLDLLVP
jgi:tight adherence protein C